MVSSFLFCTLLNCKLKELYHEGKNCLPLPKKSVFQIKFARRKSTAKIKINFFLLNILKTFEKCPLCWLLFYGIKLYILMRTVGYNGYQRKWVIRESDYWWLVTQPFWGNVCKVHFSCILLLRKILGEIIAFSSITTNHWIVNFHLYANVKHSNQLLRNWYVFAGISAFWK